MSENKLLPSKGEFEDLLKEHNGIIWKICRTYHQDADEQHDLYQEIVLQIWKTLPGFRGDSKVSTWIYRVALNMAISGFRKAKRKPAHVSLDHRMMEMPEENNSERQDQIKLMYRAIEKLTDVEKAIMLLYLDERPYEEIAGIVGITQNNLRVKMSRIREKLRTIMIVGKHG